MNHTDRTVLHLEGITKRFPGVLALDRVDFDLRKGEVHALVGENGAGKSTLIKIISGAYKKDEGTIIFDGKEMDIHNPRHAQELGIVTVYQELNLIPDLSVAENIFIGRQPLRRGPFRRIDRQRMNGEAYELMKSLEIEIDPRVTVRKLGIAQKQMVEIAKAFSVKSKVCIFDEPTAALTPNEIEELFTLINRLKAGGVGIIYISHRLEEVFRIGSRITVLRNGQVMDTKDIGEVNTAGLVEMMIGRRIEESRSDKERELGGEALRVEGLCGEKFRDVTLWVKKGEIVGIAGLVGSGRTEVLRAIFGADGIRGGSMFLRGKRVRVNTPRQALGRRIALLPEDRKAQGLVGCRSVEENITLASLGDMSAAGILMKRRIMKRVQDFVEKLKIKTPGFKQPVMYLSGGNQQKVIIARWLCAECDVLLFDEPTRGIDVGTKLEVHHLMMNLARQGAALLVVSSEIPELMRICDRIYVMHEGRVAAEFASDTLTSDMILNAAFGGTGAAVANNERRL
jgi:ribose transport system ATP-binding protein